MPKCKHIFRLPMRPRGSTTLAGHEEVVQDRKLTLQPEVMQRSETQNSMFNKVKRLHKKHQNFDLTLPSFKKGHTKELANLCHRKATEVDVSFCNLLRIYNEFTVFPKGKSRVKMSVFLRVSM